MKRITILSLLAALMLPLTLFAQVEKRVEVSKAYIPSVEYASKLAIRPNMVDTVVMQPEIDYEITPLSLSTQLETRTIRPATMTYWEFDRPLPFYLKLGMGYPLNSALDLYVSSQNADIGYVMGYVNHIGQYESVPYTPDDNHSALWMNNKVGLVAGKYLGRHTLEGEVSYENRIFDRYGIFPSASYPTFDLGSRRMFGDLQGRIRIGDDFSDLSRFNFNVEVEGGNWWNPFRDIDLRTVSSDLDWLAGDPAFENESNVEAHAAVGRKFGRHKILFGAGFEGRWGGARRMVAEQPGSDYNYYDRIISGSLRYGYQARSVDMEFGLDYYYDKIAGRDASHNFVPYAHLRFDLGNGGFVPYVELDGSLKSNSLQELMRINPYYRPSYTSPMPKNTLDYSLRVGVSGRLIQDKLNYRLFVGYSFLENHNFWFVNQGSDPVDRSFDLAQGRLNIMSLNGEIEFRPVNSFTFSIGGRAMTYTDHQDLSLCMPEFEGTVQARYTHPKFSVGLLFNLQSIRYISSLRYESYLGTGDIYDGKQTWHRIDVRSIENYRIPFTVDLGLDVNWFVSKRVTVYAEGRNLCNNRYYDWARFPLYGVSFTAGVKLNF